MDIEALKQIIIENIPQIVIFGIVSIVLLGMVLGFTKKAIFYNDYNDLGLSLATIGVPVALFLILVQVANWAIFLSMLIFVLLFGVMIYRTWTANEKKLFVTLVVSISKLALSFIYIFYLYEAFTAKKRGDRGKAWFVLAIITPLLIILVYSREGRFKLTSTGRPKLNP